MSYLLSSSPSLADSIRTSSCHYVVTGASGWLGRATLDILHQALEADFSARVTALGSRHSHISLADGQTCQIQPLLEWRPPLGKPLIIFHYAFLTMDKVGGMSMEEYVTRSESISSWVRSWIESGKVRRVVMPSSGAVYDYMQAKSRNPAALLYGKIKRDDEISFGKVCKESSSRLIIPRVFNLSGPYINKFENYALASFIFQILSARPLSIHARHPVIRSYYYVGDLLELCMQLLFKQNATAIECFDVAGDEIVELGELAQRVAEVMKDRSPLPIQRLPMLADAVEDRYIGSRERIEELEKNLGVCPMKLDDQIRATSCYIESTMR